MACGDHIPGRCFEAQLDAQFLCHGLGDVDIEAIQFILVIQEREGRVTFHEDVDQLFVFLHAIQRGAGQNLRGGCQSDQADAQQSAIIHRCPLKKCL